MKKILLGLCISILLLIAAPAAYASDLFDYPVLPDGHPDDRIAAMRKPEPEIAEPMETYEVQASSALPVEVTQTGELPGALTWTITADGDGNYTYSFDAILPTEVDGETYYYSYGQQAESTVNSFTYSFPQNGEWEIWIDVYDDGVWETREVVPVSVHLEGMDPIGISISGPQGAFFTATTTWTVSFSGGDGNYSYQIYLLETDSDLEGSGTVTYVRGTTTEHSADISYRLLASGNYQISAWVNDGNGQSEYEELAFSAESENYPSVSDKCTQLVSECRAAGKTTDYEIALWMHDWLTSHANYDYTYSHYSADGVLMAGTGVCDSYSKAFLFLMRKAGIPVTRISNNGHAWNAVQIAGDWYTLDCTWDDPGEGGYENHIYCFIPDEVMNVDHLNHNSTVTADSFEYNYYVQTGTAQEWAGSLTDSIQSGLQNGDYKYTVDFPQSYVIEGFFFNDRSSAGAVLGDRVSLALAKEHVYTYENEPVELLLASEVGDTSAEIQVSFEGRVFALPQEVTTIGEASFLGDPAVRAVIIPDSTTAIEANAFAENYGLWKVVIPGTVQSIGVNAFDSDNTHLTIVAPSDSAGARYAAENYIKYREIG